MVHVEIRNETLGILVQGTVDRLEDLDLIDKAYRTSVEARNEMDLACPDDRP